MSHSILVVDDEPDITALVAYHLAKAGYRVTTASSGDEALKAVSELKPDLLVLDLMLPGRSGYELLEHVRNSSGGDEMGVVLLTARREESDRIKGLSLGADDYVVKPFSPEELVLRIGAVLRRLGAPAVAAGSRLVYGPISIDKIAHTVSCDGEEIDLTAKEYKLLVALAERAGRVQSRAELLQRVWQANPDIQTRTVDMHVQRLRSKLGKEAANLIETVRGFGYRLRLHDQ